MAKILLFDIESSNLNADFGRVLCVGYKWHGEKKVKIIRITDSPTFKKDCTDDSYVVGEFQKITEQADMLVSWFGVRFDVPFLQSRLLVHGLPLIPPIPHFDGWWVARKKLKLHSNRLASVQAFLGLPTSKTIIEPNLWVKAMSGNKDAIRYVEDHCYKDVDVLEQAYDRIKTLLPTHANVGMMDDRPDCCAVCGEKGSYERRGTYTSKAKKVFRFKCSKCGSWTLGTKNIAFLQPEKVAA